MNQKYEEPTSISKEETLKILNGSESTERKVNAIVGAINYLDDPVWLQELWLIHYTRANLTSLQKNLKSFFLPLLHIERLFMLYIVYFHNFKEFLDFFIRKRRARISYALENLVLLLLG